MEVCIMYTVTHNSSLLLANISISWNNRAVFGLGFAILFLPGDYLKTLYNSNSDI